MKLKCFKGFTDSENLNIICLQGDTVELRDVDEGEVLLVGVSGFCRDLEISLTPKQVVAYFEIA